MKSIKRFRFHGQPEELLPLEKMRHNVRIKKTMMSRYNIVGIPASHIDVVVQDGANVCELIEKNGKYDNKVRYRLAFRKFAHKDAERLRVGTVDMVRKNRISVGGMEITFPYHNPELKDPGHVKRIFIWHLHRFYSFLLRELPDSDLDAESESWAFSFLKRNENPTITAANRSASRWLYRLARDFGYRKMTMRERIKAGLPSDSPCWQRLPHIETGEVFKKKTGVF